MKKESKCLLLALGGCGLLIPGINLLMWVMSVIDFHRVVKFNFWAEIGGLQLWPVYIFATCMIVVGLICILGALLYGFDSQDKK